MAAAPRRHAAAFVVSVTATLYDSLNSSSVHGRGVRLTPPGASHPAISLSRSRYESHPRPIRLRQSHCLSDRGVGCV
jgi:hypothetical protein